MRCYRVEAHGCCYYVGDWIVEGDPLPPPKPYPRFVSPQQHHDLHRDRWRWRNTTYWFVDPTKADA